ncbi:uncharacterized protein LOC120672752 [Panicum virgatum]|uniref:uncharacterized protein LOC120672752 n=1 Tax=Panicum virgatum TaxID=38727 RepID=UPI0019D543C7|nr:uncharacterized protein LOC120672752 [Panicum virgatum]
MRSGWCALPDRWRQARDFSAFNLGVRFISANSMRFQSSSHDFRLPGLPFQAYHTSSDLPAPLAANAEGCRRKEWNAASLCWMRWIQPLIYYLIFHNSMHCNAGDRSIWSKIKMITY